MRWRRRQGARSRRRGAGVVLLIAMAALTFIGLASAAMSASFSRELKATRDAVQAAQVDELVAAGEAAARGWASDGSLRAGDEKDVALPAGLAQRYRVSVAAAGAGGGGLAVVVRVGTVDGRQVREEQVVVEAAAAGGG